MAKKAAGAQLKADFDAAHRAGKKALQDRDFDRLGRVIERERQLIEQQRLQIDKKAPKSQKR